MYLGAFMQKYIPAYLLKIILGMILLAVAIIFFYCSLELKRGFIIPFLRENPIK